MFQVTPHAMERFREAYPKADTSRALKELSSGETISPELVQALTARKTPSTEDTYILTKGHTGIFVIAKNNVVVTFLRLGLTQQQVLKNASTLHLKPQVHRRGITATATIPLLKTSCVQDISFTPKVCGLFSDRDQRNTAIHDMIDTGERIQNNLVVYVLGHRLVLRMKGLKGCLFTEQEFKENTLARQKQELKQQANLDQYRAKQEAELLSKYADWITSK